MTKRKASRFPGGRAPRESRLFTRALRGICTEPKEWFSLSETWTELSAIPVQQRVAAIRDLPKHERADSDGRLQQMVRRADIDAVMQALPLPPTTGGAHPPERCEPRDEDDGDDA